jgi:hypothetical protein
VTAWLQGVMVAKSAFTLAWPWLIMFVNIFKCFMKYEILFWASAGQKCRVVKDCISTRLIKVKLAN